MCSALSELLYVYAWLFVLAWPKSVNRRLIIYSHNSAPTRSPRILCLGAVCMTICSKSACTQFHSGLTKLRQNVLFHCGCFQCERKFTLATEGLKYSNSQSQPCWLLMSTQAHFESQSKYCSNNASIMMLFTCMNE